MPHQRYRFCETVLAKDLTFSPCVGVLGMRQVGKSTLLKRFAKRYGTFDDEAFLGEFRRDAKSLFVTPPFPFALDEIQKYPPAFDALKFAIDEHKIPGRFLISGSVRFSSRKGIRESLTGRLVTVNLLPFSLAECDGKPLGRFVEMALGKSGSRLVASLAPLQWVLEKNILRYLEHGGMPGICFGRDSSIRGRYFTAHLDTLFGRDIHLIRQTNLTVATLTVLMRGLAAIQGVPVNLAALARVANTSIPTVKHMLAAFEGLFLIRPYGKTYYVEDPGLARSLYHSGDRLDRQGMIEALFHELRAQINYRPALNASLSPYTTRGGVSVPFVVTTPSGVMLAIAVDDMPFPSEKSLKSLTWFRKSYPKAKVLVLCRRDDAVTTTNGTLCLPWTWVF